MRPEHIAAMQAGRRAAADARRQSAEARVEAFRAWLRAGSVLRDIPEIPTDADFAAVEGTR